MACVHLYLAPEVELAALLLSWHHGPHPHGHLDASDPSHLAELLKLHQIMQIIIWLALIRRSMAVLRAPLVHDANARPQSGFIHELSPERTHRRLRHLIRAWGPLIHEYVIQLACDNLLFMRLPNHPRQPRGRLLPSTCVILLIPTVHYFGIILFDLQIDNDSNSSKRK